LAIKEDKSNKKAFNEALKILAKRDMSSSGLAGKLLSKGFSREEITDAAELLKNKGYLDDSKLAARQAQIYLDKGKGFFYIKHHLHNLGFSEMPQIELKDEIKVILEIVKKKGLSRKKLAERETRVKIMVFLSRRGFRQDAISKALRGLEETEG
jgi:regulatory protein